MIVKFKPVESTVEQVLLAHPSRRGGRETLTNENIQGDSKIEQPEKSTIVESKPSELAALWTQVSIADVTANAEQEEQTPWRGIFDGNNKDKRDHRSW